MVKVLDWAYMYSQDVRSNDNILRAGRKASYGSRVEKNNILIYGLFIMIFMVF